MAISAPGIWRINGIQCYLAEYHSLLTVFMARKSQCPPSPLQSCGQCPPISPSTSRILPISTECCSAPKGALSGPSRPVPPGTVPVMPAGACVQQDRSRWRRSECQWPQCPQFQQAPPSLSRSGGFLWCMVVGSALLMQHSPCPGGPEGCLRPQCLLHTDEASWEWWWDEVTERLQKCPTQPPLVSQLTNVGN